MGSRKIKLIEPKELHALGSKATEAIKRIKC